MIKRKRALVKNTTHVAKPINSGTNKSAPSARGDAPAERRRASNRNAPAVANGSIIPKRSGKNGQRKSQLCALSHSISLVFGNSRSLQVHTNLRSSRRPAARGSADQNANA